MAAYLSLAIVQELLDSVESDSAYGDSVKALANGLLNFYFPITDGWIVVPKSKPNHHPADFLILRVQRRHSSHQRMVDHIIVEARKATDDIDSSLEQQQEEELETALEQSNIEGGRCWALLFHGLDLRFFEYHGYLPVRARLVPWGYDSQPMRNSYHLRSDSVVVDEMLRYMSQNPVPVPRWLMIGEWLAGLTWGFDKDIDEGFG